MTEVPVNWVSLGNRVAIVLQFKTGRDEDKDTDATYDVCYVTDNLCFLFLTNDVLFWFMTLSPVLL